MDMKFDSINTWWKKLKPSVFETAQIQNFSVLKYAKENDIEKYKIIIKSAEMYDTTFLEKVLRSSEDEDLSHQYFEDFIKYAPKYLFHVEDLNDKIISKILQKRRYATDSENIELLTEHFIGNMNVGVKLKFINDSNQDLNLRLGVLRKAIDQIDLEEIKDEAFWDEALNCGIMNATIANLNHYYEKKGFSKELQDFILVNKFNDDGEKLANGLFSEMLVSNAISDEIMIQFISVIDIKDEFLWKNIKSGSNFKKLLLLIESDLIALTPDVFETIRDNNELLPDILITQNVVDFLVEQNIKPLPGWITQFIDSKLLNIKKFLKTFIMLLNEQQYQKAIHLLSNQSEKFEKILNHSRGYANQKIAMVDDNELLLKWLEGNSFIKSFSDDNRGNYVLK